MLGIIDAVMESSLLSDHSDPIPVCYSQQTWKSVHERPASRSQESTGLQLHLTNSKSESESCSDVSHSSRPHGLYGPWDSPGQNIGMGSFSLLQGIFPTQGLNPGLPRCRWILYQLSHKGSPRILEWVAYPFSSGSSQPRNRTGVSCIAGGFFTNQVIREAPTTRVLSLK